MKEKRGGRRGEMGEGCGGRREVGQGGRLSVPRGRRKNCLRTGALLSPASDGPSVGTSVFLFFSFFTVIKCEQMCQDF